MSPFPEILLLVSKLGNSTQKGKNNIKIMSSGNIIGAYDW